MHQRELKTSRKRHADFLLSWRFERVHFAFIMPPKTGTTQSQSPEVQENVASHPTPERLAEMACLLSKNQSDEPKALVKRALEIWNAANEELSGTRQYDASEWVSFDEIAEEKLLPALRAAYQNVESSKGVGKSVDRYFELLVKDYDQSMKERLINPSLLKANKAELERLRKKILDEKQMPKRVLDQLTQFRRDMRKKFHQVSALEIREVLGGVDIGTPSPDL